MHSKIGGTESKGQRAWERQDHSGARHLSPEEVQGLSPRVNSAVYQDRGLEEVAKTGVGVGEGMTLAVERDREWGQMGVRMCGARQRGALREGNPCSTRN